MNTDKYALITGASRGIGAGIARSLAKTGYNLALICEKNEEMQRTLSEELSREYGIYCICFVGDVSKEDFVSSMAKEVLRCFPRLDVLVNNAGIWEGGLITDISASSFLRLMEVNLFGYFLISKAFVPTMVNQKSGNIINISSVWGVTGASCEVAYSATKGGINAMTLALAKELAPSGIRVNAIAPGVIETDMNASLSPETQKILLDEIKMGRIGTPADIGDTVISILGSHYMTGQILTVDGGFI